MFQLLLNVSSTLNEMSDMIENVPTGKEIDMAVVIAIAALIFSVLSPILSAVITGSYRLKEKKLEMESEQIKRRQTFYNEHRAQVIENYIRSVGAQIAGMSTDIETDYNAAMGEVYLYLDTSLWYLIEKIDTELVDGDVELAKDSLVTLCKQLSNDKIRK